MARRGPDHVAIIVDEVGVGSGVMDNLSEMKFDVAGFKGGRSTNSGQEGLFANLRAQSQDGISGQSSRLTVSA